MRAPNIILILSDNQPADLLGCYGNQEIHTPNLDQMASEGVQFDHAYGVNAMCSPCRATLLTGLMPSQHGLHTWLDDRLMDRWPAGWNSLAEFETLPQILKRHGYQTALIGKYHLGVPDAPQNGFDYWLTFPLGHTRTFWNNVIIDNGRRYTYDGHITDCFAEKAVAYLQEQRPGAARPFFLYLPFSAPYGHWPSIKGPARNRFAARYADTPMHSIPRRGLSLAAITRFLQRQDQGGGGIDYTSHLRIPNDLESLRNFFSQMSLVDDGVGRVLAALAGQGLAEETLVIYSSDHGFSLGHHGFWGHSQATWPANAHRAAYNIPLIMRQPGRIPPRRAAEMLVSQRDLAATILDYAGLDAGLLPEGASTRSFAPWLRGEPYEPAPAVFMEQEETRGIRTRRWVYWCSFDGRPEYPAQEFLYEWAADPDEEHNLAGDRARATVVAELRQRLAEFFSQNSDPAYDLWRGGRAKSNVEKPWLWQAAWGKEWRPGYGRAYT